MMVTYSEMMMRMGWFQSPNATIATGQGLVGQSTTKSYKKERKEEKKKTREKQGRCSIPSSFDGKGSDGCNATTSNVPIHDVTNIFDFTP